MKDIVVVHLIRAHNGIEPFRLFLDSYRDNQAGIDHDLLIIFKGFKRHEDASEYRKLLASLPYLSLEISDEGFDITAYFKAFGHYSKKYRYFCFLNSFSMIQDREWLKKLHSHIIRPGVGLVGATGSWQGLGMRLPNYNLGSAIRSKILFAGKDGNAWDGITYVIQAIWRRLTFPIYFDSFPNYHLRTNAFMISSEIWNRLDFSPIRSKMDALKFESGKKGLTRQVLGLGKQVLVVGRDGIGYDMASWSTSGTFWQSEQENLLVTDNQTRNYQGGSSERRAFLSFSAWGKRAGNGS
ncbi:MAG: hypothetical protein GC139_08000 [Sideroxydans sp.]|nr:hypothetical protein [Sideroxydans sp.]